MASKLTEEIGAVLERLRQADEVNGNELRQFISEVNTRENSYTQQWFGAVHMNTARTSAKILFARTDKPIATVALGQQSVVVTASNGATTVHKNFAEARRQLVELMAQAFRAMEVGEEAA